MATTTAAVTLTSDLLSDNMSVSASTTCMKAGTTADGLDMMEYGYVDVASGTAQIMIHAQDIGRLYGGDWMFVPADFHDGNADIMITALTGTNKIEYALVHEGTALTAS